MYLQIIVFAVMLLNDPYTKEAKRWTVKIETICRSVC